MAAHQLNEVVVRNPVFNHCGGVDCEIFHEEYGWVPYTASPDDSSSMGRQIFGALLLNIAGPILLPEKPPVPPEIELRRSQLSVGRYQLRAMLRQIGELERLDQAIKCENGGVKHAWEEAPSFRRMGEVASVVGRVLGLDDEGLDEFFGQARRIIA